MLIVKKKPFIIGTVMAFTFLVVLVLMFLPLLGGRNAFEASDRLFNSIAKASSDHFELLRREAADHRGSSFDAAMTFRSESLAAEVRAMLAKAGVKAEGKGVRVEAVGDLYEVARAVIDDSEAMFHNRGLEIAQKYGSPERQTLLAWWNILKEMQRVFESKGRFQAATFLHDLTVKGVEVAYNFYGVEPENASTSAATLVGTLVFYVLYTLWWGYAILYMFNGLGMEMKAGAKKEV